MMIDYLILSIQGNQKFKDTFTILNLVSPQNPGT
jgi:hypothetical protein